MEIEKAVKEQLANELAGFLNSGIKNSVAALLTETNESEISRLKNGNSERQSIEKLISMIGNIAESKISVSAYIPLPNETSYPELLAEMIDKDMLRQQTKNIRTQMLSTLKQEVNIDHHYVHYYVETRKKAKTIIEKFLAETNQNQDAQDRIAILIDAAIEKDLEKYQDEITKRAPELKREMDDFQEQLDKIYPVISPAREANA